MTYSKSIEKWIRPGLKEFTGCAANKSPGVLPKKTEILPEEIVKLNSNENPYGCSPR